MNEPKRPRRPGETTRPTEARALRLGPSEQLAAKAARWLKRRTVEEMIDDGDYQEAIDRMQAELSEEAPPSSTRARRQLLGETLAFLGRTDEAVKVLQPVLREYLEAHQTAKAIAIQKVLSDLGAYHSAEEELEVIATALAAPLETAVRTPLFSDFSRAELLAVIRGLHLTRRGPGDVVMFEGEPGSSLFVLTEGTVRVFVRGASGWSSEIREIQAPAFFGEISVVSDKPRTATVTCKTRCELLELHRSTVAEITKTHKGVTAVLKAFCDERDHSPEEEAGRAR